MHLRDIQVQAWQTAEDKGFHAHLAALPPREQALIRLALIHTEVSECAQEVKRRGVTPETRPALAEELADTIIRIADLAGCLTVDLDLAVQRKLAINAQRPMHYGTPREERAP